jgi:hypothetical protein
MRISYISRYVSLVLFLETNHYILKRWNRNRNRFRNRNGIAGACRREELEKMTFDRF